MKFLPNTVTALIVLAAQTNLASSSTQAAAHAKGLRGSNGRNLFVSMTKAEVRNKETLPVGNQPPQGSQPGGAPQERPPPEGAPPQDRPETQHPPQESQPGSAPQNTPENHPPQGHPGEVATPNAHPSPPQNLRDCSLNKKVTLYKFCITGDHDQGINGEHKLILNEFMDGEEKYKENKCHELDYQPQIVQAGEKLVVGTIEHDDDETEEFMKELHADRWYAETCEPYYIALSKDFSRLFTGPQSWSGCWFSQHSGDKQPQGLHYDHCPENHYERPRDSFNWFLKVEPDSGGKVNYPNWHDSAGREFDCVWYSYGNRCAEIGGSYENFGYNAKEACTTCGGGVFL